MNAVFEMKQKSPDQPIYRDARSLSPSQNPKSIIEDSRSLGALSKQSLVISNMHRNFGKVPN